MILYMAASQKRVVFKQLELRHLQGSVTTTWETDYLVLNTDRMCVTSDSSAIRQHRTNSGRTEPALCVFAHVYIVLGD